MDLCELTMLRENLELLANGKDPKTGYALEDTILRSEFNKKIFSDAASVIDQLLKCDSNPRRIDRRRKRIFFLTPEQRLNVCVSTDPISISAFVYVLNKEIDSSKMKKLKAVQITSWLLKEGFLTELEHDDGRKFKTTTEKAKTIGIFTEERKSDFGRVYDVCMYTETAQRYILNHLDEILSEEFQNNT